MKNTRTLTRALQRDKPDTIVNIMSDDCENVKGGGYRGRSSESDSNGLHTYIYIYIRTYICVCVCVCVSVFIFIYMYSAQCLADRPQRFR